MGERGPLAGGTLGGRKYAPFSVREFMLSLMLIVGYKISLVTSRLIDMADFSCILVDLSSISAPEMGTGRLA